LPGGHARDLRRARRAGCWSAFLDVVPGASAQTQRVKILDANRIPGTAGKQEQFEILITEDDQRRVVPASAASVTAVAALAGTGTVYGLGSPRMTA